MSVVSDLQFVSTLRYVPGTGTSVTSVAGDLQRIGHPCKLIAPFTRCHVHSFCPRNFRYLTISLPAVIIFTAEAGFLRVSVSKCHLPLADYPTRLPA